MHAIDSSNCDREPIHIPGAIQAHGALLVLDPASEQILQAAGDLAGLLGFRGSALGEPVNALLGTRLETLRRSAGLGLGREPVYLGSVRPAALQGEVDVIAHERNGVIILELEPAPKTRSTAAHFLAAVRAITAALEAAPPVRRLCEIAAREIRRFTGFDRVMIYRFLDDGSGCVLAEDKAAELPSFLNHHYPASDIPRQARDLYLRNLIRVIPDVHCNPAPLEPSVCPKTGQPLDMSDCALRSVSPIHIQYLKNMDVSASMSVSIVIDGALWGLIACHHRAPKFLPYELREACTHIGQVLSQQIAAREEIGVHAEARRLADARDEFMGNLARAVDSPEDALVKCTPELLSVLPSDGVAVYRSGEVAGAGHRPSDADIQDLTAWLLRDDALDSYATDRLSEQHAPADAYRAQASGLLSAVVSHAQPLVLLWFRAEYPQVIDWAGNPHKPVEPGSTPGAMTPRKSFDLWRETVHGRSQPWTPAEIDAARRFRDAVVDLSRQRRLEELNRQLRHTLADKEALVAQKDLLMREVNHRVQNSLQLVHSMLQLQEQRATDPILVAHFAEARRRLLAVSAVHRRLWRSDQIESVRLDTYLRELRDDLVSEWGSSWDEQISLRTTPVLVPTNVAVMLALVVTELLTNAVKHAYGGVPGPIDLTIPKAPNGTVRITIADQGTGLEQRERPGGFGSQLTRLLVAQVKGEIEFEDNRPGTRVVLNVPLPRADHPASHGEAAATGTVSP